MQKIMPSTLWASAVDQARKTIHELDQLDVPDDVVARSDAARDLRDAADHLDDAARAFRSRADELAVGPDGGRVAVIAGRMYLCNCQNRRWMADQVGKQCPDCKTTIAALIVAR